MTTDDKERDFEEINSQLRFPGRFDPRLLSNDDNAGDGFPGLQKMVRNWVKYYLSNGVIEEAIHMNSKKITNVLDPTDDQDAATKKHVDDEIVTHTADVNAHIDNLTDIPTRDHSDLQGITANQHIDNLTDIPTRDHSDLQNIGTSDHHVLYTDVEARTAINDIFGSDGKADSTIDLDAQYLDNVEKIILDEISEPATPSADHGVLYLDTLNRLLFKDEGGDIYLIDRYQIEYGFFAGGIAISYVDTIDYIDETILTGNAIDKGNLTDSRSYLAGCSGPTYGFFGGGDD